MSFYSSIIFCANHGYDKSITKADVVALALKHSIIRTDKAWAEGLYETSTWIGDMFESEEKRKENERLFAPGDFSLSHDIEFYSWDDSFDGKGIAVNLSGNGYFFPYEPREMLEVMLSHESLKLFIEELETMIGGHYTAPKLHHRKLFRNYAIFRNSGWAVLFSETG